MVGEAGRAKRTVAEERQEIPAKAIRATYKQL